MATNLKTKKDFILVRKCFIYKVYILLVNTGRQTAHSPLCSHILVILLVAFSQSCNKLLLAVWSSSTKGSVAKVPFILVTFLCHQPKPSLSAVQVGEDSMARNMCAANYVYLSWLPRVCCVSRLYRSSVVNAT